MAELRGVSKLNWSLSSREIKEETEQLIERAGKVFDSIGSLQKEDVSFENTLKVCILKLGLIFRHNISSDESF